MDAWSIHESDFARINVQMIVEIIAQKILENIICVYFSSQIIAEIFSEIL